MALDLNKPTVFVTMIRANSQSCTAAALAFANASRGACNMLLDPHRQSTAFLRNYNGWWLDALNIFYNGHPEHQIPPGTCKYAAMIHSDIAAEHGWLDVLMEEMTRLDCDAISAAPPFRDDSGLTSVGIDMPGWDSFTPRRLTVREILRLPETFTVKDTDTPNGTLLLNNGLCLARIDKPWADHQDCIFDFKVRKRVIDGVRHIEQESEDWRWSRFMASQGVPYCGTRKTRLRHVGEHSWPNFLPYGQETDELFKEKSRQRGQDEMVQAVTRATAPMAQQLAELHKRLDAFDKLVVVPAGARSAVEVAPPVGNLAPRVELNGELAHA